jgi:hypothetical protein
MSQVTHSTVRPSARLKVLALGALVTLLLTVGGSFARANGGPQKTSAAAGKVQTLHFFSKDVSVRITTADGTVIRKPPYPEAKPGDVLEVNSLDYAGNHRNHAARWSASQHLRCVFSTGEPNCESQVAIRGSLLIFGGNPGTLINGTGRYQGATGRVISNREVRGGSDVVARIHLHG